MREPDAQRDTVGEPEFVTAFVVGNAVRVTERQRDTVAVPDAQRETETVGEPVREPKGVGERVRDPDAQRDTEGEPDFVTAFVVGNAVRVTERQRETDAVKDGCADDVLVGYQVASAFGSQRLEESE